VQHQTVTYDSGALTWTGGAANTPNAADDVVTFTEDTETDGTVTVHSTSDSAIDITSDSGPNCTGDGTDTVTCTDVTSVTGNASGGNDSVDASGLRTLAASLDGSDGTDTLTGGPQGDTIYGGADGDTIDGGAGDDTIYGDSFTINGVGTDGPDTINGGPDNDSIDGQGGNDTLNGNDGIDEIYGGDGDDTIDGGAGDDANNYICCYSTISGGLYGDAGNDTINGGDGIDYADGGTGNDTINGGAGDDSWFNGCYGALSKSPKDAQSSPSGDLCSSSVSGGLYGGSGDDTVNGGDGDDYIGGYYGNLSAAQGDESDNDHLSGDAGWDVMFGDSGDDVMNGGAGNDYMYGGDGNDTMDGGDDTDYVDGQNDNDVVNGGAGDDSSGYYADEGPEYGVFGGDGNDQVDGGPGTDYVDGGNDNDTVNGGDGNDSITFYDCPAEVVANLNICSVQFGGVHGGNGNDTVNGGNGADYVNGDDGDDTVDGGAGNDEFDISASEQPAATGCYYCYGSGWPGVNGGDGNDNVNGGDGNDDVSGDYGADNTNGGPGDDNITEENDGSPDNANGGTGVDYLYYSAYGTTNQPITITLDDQADDGQAPDSEDPESYPGDPGNNFGSDIDNVEVNTSCSGDTIVCDFANEPNGSPAKIVGTAAANLIWGSYGNDDITGGDGADYMSGGYGDDTFHARDGYPDYVDCDEGNDTAIVDQFDTVHNCENVDRANVPSAFDTSKPPVVVTPQSPPAQPPSNKDTTPPQVSLNVPKTTFTPSQLVAGVRATLGCNEDCALSLRLLAQQASGSATFSRVRGYNVVVGRRSVGFGKTKRNVRVRPCERKQGGPQSKVCLKRFNKALNARLKKTGKVTMKLRAVATDRSGNRTTKVKTITITKGRQ
jgi:Ca2+-binding RTX toxin-like protein